METFLKSVAEYCIMLRMHPRTQISVTVQICQDDGGVLACSVNALVLALMDAGLPMHNQVAAVSFMSIPSANSATALYTMDPILKETASISPSLHGATHGASKGFNGTTHNGDSHNGVGLHTVVLDQHPDRLNRLVACDCVGLVDGGCMQDDDAWWVCAEQGCKHVWAMMRLSMEQRIDQTIPHKLDY
jgi:hypothetical protein